MKRTAVDSSVIAVVGYDSATSVLEIEFHNGRIYGYFDVPADVYHALMAADSIGGYFNEEIRSAYSTTQLRR